MNTTKILSLLGTFVLFSCQNADNQEQHDLSPQVIEVHDEIMPMIPGFDKAALKVDSILTNLDSIYAENQSLDTAEITKELTQLKSDLEEANDRMMVWMREYAPDSLDNDYQESEMKKISELREFFHKVSEQKDKNLHTFQ